MDEGLQRKVVIGVAVTGAIGCLGLYLYTRKQRQYHRVARVSKLYLHPVKSLTAVEVNEGEVTPRGFKSNGIYDRSFMVVDENNHFVTARTYPKMILIKPSFSEDKNHLVLSAEGKPDINVPLEQDGPIVQSKVWALDVSGLDCGDEIAQWISEFVGGTFRLLFYSEKLPGKQLVKEPLYGHRMKNNETALYQDFNHINMLSEASVEDLNTKIEESVTERNFRPNIYVTDCTPYAEDFWKYVKIGEDVELRFTNYCARCKMTTLNHKMGNYTSLDPLKTMKEYRQCYDFADDRNSYGKKPIFGTKLNLETGGTLRVGDPVYASLQFQEHSVN